MLGGVGGTVDHIDPVPAWPDKKGGYGEWLNLTGSCSECNRKKDTGNGKHRSPLQMLSSRRDIAWRNRKCEPESWLSIGDEVLTPFGKIGRIASFDPLLVDIPYHKRWRCANPASLKKGSDG